MTTRTPNRDLSGSPILLIGGAILIIAGNIAHPIDGYPTPLSRLEIATEPTWIAIHLAFALGFLLRAAGRHPSRRPQAW